MFINKFTSIKCTFIHSYTAWKLHTATPLFADSGPWNQTTDAYRPHRKLFVRFISAPLNKCLLLDHVHSITPVDHIYKNSKNLSVIFRQAEVQPSSGLLSHESAPCFLCRSKVHSCFCLSVFISSLSSFGLMRLVWCFWVSVLPSAQNVTDYPLHLPRHRYAHLSSPFSQEDEGLAHLVQIWHILIIFPACWSLIALSVQQRSPWDFQGWKTYLSSAKKKLQ